MSFILYRNFYIFRIYYSLIFGNHSTETFNSNSIIRMDYKLEFPNLQEVKYGYLGH